MPYLASCRLSGQSAPDQRSVDSDLNQIPRGLGGDVEINHAATVVRVGRDHRVHDVDRIGRSYRPRSCQVMPPSSALGACGSWSSSPSESVSSADPCLWPW